MVLCSVRTVGIIILIPHMVIIRKSQPNYLLYCSCLTKVVVSLIAGCQSLAQWLAQSRLITSASTVILVHFLHLYLLHVCLLLRLCPVWNFELLLVPMCSLDLGNFFALIFNSHNRTLIIAFVGLFKNALQIKFWVKKII